MSNYERLTKNPDTGEFETAQWMDDYFGPHRYGVKFAGDQVFSADDYEWEFKDNE